MKLGIKKLAHNFLALAVSVCMICTLTPSAAWAQSVDGVSPSANGVAQTIGDGTGTSASASTVVKVTAIDDSFAFVSISNPYYADSKDNLKTLIGENPITATFRSKEALPDNFVVEWGYEEVVASPDDPSGYVLAEGSSWHSVKKNQYDSPHTITPDASTGDYTFELAASEINFDDLKDNVIYRFTVDLSESDASGNIWQNPDADNKVHMGDSSSASTIVSIQTDYPYRILNAKENSGVADSTRYGVEGNIYTAPPLCAPDVEVTKASNATISKIRETSIGGKDNTEPENVVAATQMTITYPPESPLPDNTNSYQGQLKVNVPLPQEYVDYLAGLNPNQTPAAGTSINVYVCDADGNVKKVEATIEKVKNEDGSEAKDEHNNPIYVAQATVEGTGQTLGTFAVGIPIEGMFTVEASAVEKNKEGKYVETAAGQINPMGGVQVPLTGASFSASVTTPSYTLEEFRIKVGSQDAKTVPASDIGHTFEFTYDNIANEYGIKSGDTVSLQAVFKRITESQGKYSLTLKVEEVNGAGGKVKAMSAINVESTDPTLEVVAGSSRTEKFVDYKGVYLQFEAKKGTMTEVSIDGKVEADVKGSNYLIGALTHDTTVVVKFDGDAIAPEQPLMTVDAEVPPVVKDDGTVVQRGLLNISKKMEDGSVVPDKVAKNTYSVPAGNMISISAEPLPDYKLASAELTIKNSDGKEITTSVSHTATKDDSSGVWTIRIYNVLEPMAVEIQFVPNDTVVNITYDPSGGRVDIGEPDDGISWEDWDKLPQDVKDALIAQGVQPPTRNSRAKEASMEPQAQGVQTFSMFSNSMESQSGTMDEETHGKLEEGQRLRPTFTPIDGYEIGRITVNGITIDNSYLTPRYDSSGRIKYYTVTIIKNESGVANSIQGYWPDDPDTITKLDKVFAIQQPVLNMTVTFNPKIPTGEDFVSVTTKVVSINDGHGTVSGTPGTPGDDGNISYTMYVPKGGDAKIDLFPDETSKVSSIVDSDGNPYTADASSNGRWLTLAGLNDNANLIVTFEGGQQPPTSRDDVFTISASAGVGGSISPAGDNKVYKGSTALFSFQPNTGYEVSKVFVDDVEVDLTGNGYTYQFENINADARIYVTFKEMEGSPESSYTVNVSHTGMGQVSPEGNISPVAAGGKVSLVMIPDAGYRIDAVWVKSASAAPGEKGVNMKQVITNNYFYTYSDVQDNLNIVIEFGEAPDGGPGTVEEDKIIKLTDADNSYVEDGAIITPSLDSITLVKAEGQQHSASPLAFTVSVASGYTLNATASDGNGGITIKDGTADNTRKDEVKIIPAGDGVYSVIVPGEFVTSNFKIEVYTTQKTTVNNQEPHSVTVRADGPGKVSPIGTTSEPVVYVWDGQSQTFTFMPDKGNKLFSLYVGPAKLDSNGEPVKDADGLSVMDNNQMEQATATDNVYVLNNVTKDMVIQAVFSKLESGDTPPSGKDEFNVKVVEENSDLAKTSPSPTNATVYYGDNVSITFQPKDGYKARAFKGNASGEEYVVSNNTLQLSNITANTTVWVKYVPSGNYVYKKLTVTYEGSGKVSPTGSMMVEAGSSQTITALPDEGYGVKEVWVGNNSASNNVFGDSNFYNKNDGTLKVTVEQDTTVHFVFDTIANGGVAPSSDTTYYEASATVSGSGGSITPGYAKAASGAKVSFTVVPLAGYELATLMRSDGSTPRDVKGEMSGNVYTETMTSNINLVATFKQTGDVNYNNFYTVFASCGEGGSISPSGANVVSGGGSITFSITPDSKKTVDTIAVTYGSGSASKPITKKDFNGSDYTLFNVSEDQIIYVTFKDDPNNDKPATLQHEIISSVSVEGGGSISPSGTNMVNDGSNFTYTFQPDEGYKLSYIIVDGMNVRAASIVNSQYTFTNVKENHSIEAVFIESTLTAKNFVTVVVNGNGNGTVEPSGNVLVEVGHDKTISVAPFYGYKVSDIRIGDLSSSTSIKNGGDFSTTNYSRGGNDGYFWNHTEGTLTLQDLQTDMQTVSVEFAKETSGGGAPSTPTATYEQLRIKTAGSNGAGGTTNYGDGVVYFEVPDAGASDYDDLKNMDVTLIPNSGCIADPITVTYGDKSKDVYTPSGMKHYDADGNEDAAKSNPSLTTSQVFKDGYVRVSTVNGSVDLKVDYRHIDSSDGVSESDQPKLATIKATYSGGGRMTPAGSAMKVAQGSTVTFQLMPQNGYEVASFKVEGKSEPLTSTRSYRLDANGLNYAVEAVFGYVQTEDEPDTHTVKVNYDGSSGSYASPVETEVQDGRSVVVYFFPANGYLVGNVDVYGESSGSHTTHENYDSPSLTLSNVTENMEVNVGWVENTTGKPTWSVTGVEVTASVGAGNGKVSPTTASVPVGTAQQFNLMPDNGWEVDYVSFNGATTYLPAGTRSYSATPIPDTDTQDYENNLAVYFKKVEAQPDQIVKVNVLPGEDGGLNGWVSPESDIVPYGSTTTVFLYPDMPGSNGKNYTVESVKCDGRDLEWKPVKEKSGAGSNTFYDAYYVELADVRSESSIDVKFREITEPGSDLEKIDKHVMTIESEGGGMVDPVGEVTLAEGASRVIALTPFDSYYVQSVIQTNYDESGNIVGTLDLTGNITGRSVVATMGAYNCNVKVTFKDVNSDSPDNVNVGLNSSMLIGSSRNIDMTMSTNTMGGTDFDADGWLIDSADNKVEFPRYSTPDFYFITSEKGPNGRPLVLASVSYVTGGQSKDLQFIPNSNFVSGVMLNATGKFDVVWREADADAPVITPGERYSIQGSVVGGSGTIDPSVAQEKSPGETVRFSFAGAKFWRVTKLEVVRYDKDNNEIDRQGVDPFDYRYGYYDATVDSPRVEVEVTFEEGAYVNIDWNKEYGYITPNHAPGEPIWMPNDQLNTSFVVAPYSGCYVQSVALNGSEIASTEFAQGQAVEDYLKGVVPDAVIEKSGTGNGLIHNEEEEAAAGEGGSGSSSSSAGTYAMRAQPTIITPGYDAYVPPTSNVFARAYSFTPALVGSSHNTLSAMFYNPNAVVNTYEITVKSNGPGTVYCSGAVVDGKVVVNEGDTPTFSFTPDDGYTVLDVKVDGQSWGKGNSITLQPVAANHTVEVTFGTYQTSGNPFDRALRTLARMAQTGDLTGPVVGLFLLIAAAGLAITGISYFGRRRRTHTSRR